MEPNTDLTFCLIQDNDCHWYVIPVDQTSDFWEWVEAMEQCTDTHLDFNSCMVNGPKHITFDSWRHVDA